MSPKTSSRPHLVVFFTRGMSLRAWDEMGVLERELAIYRAMRQHVGGIALLTYGGREDLAYARDGLKVLCNRWGLPTAVYRWLIPWLHWRELADADAFKTNQTHGSESALWAHRFHRRARLIARCGYLWSWNVERSDGSQGSREHRRAVRRERAAFLRADRVVVTAEAGKRYVMDRYGVSDRYITVIPNYVQTELFRDSMQGGGGGKRVLFVGRLHEEKNLLALVEAAAGLGVELVMIGDGPLRASLERSARTHRVQLTLLGRRPNRELPKYFAHADLFILPSKYENHPKALLEAMAAGMPVIGSDVEGIRPLIAHQRTGYLCGTSAPELRAAMVHVLSDAALRIAMGQQAREFVLERFSLERALRSELKLIFELLGLPVPAIESDQQGSDSAVRAVHPVAAMSEEAA